ncbi:hypothetical protein ACFU8R_10315 [Pseudonocardia alni]|jgi:hypothetical protein|uniref:Uncharacterized protein n=1 Tax=Pseudonocardia alni TaxID=33907 RepID=A0AA44ZPR7_PSEA5|nr:MULTISPECIES: hypothetical protein [Pseudonocardia]MYW74834.1 hypothetical protein [Pseudonocardia sp. SID8383]OJG05756.1 hypothetical protein BG618_03356 [Pseudonocardia autotrophica]PKB31177.1 hypothetical protein ATL51_2858 [Pseudonocardia alni]
MVLTILAVVPVLAVLLVMAAQPLFELWDARASERDAARPGAGVPASPDDAVAPLPVAPAAYPEALGDVAAALRVPAPRRPLVPVARPAARA